MRNAWLVRPFPCKIRRIEEFKEQNIIAVGWPKTGDLKGKSRQNIKDILSDTPYSLTGLELGNAYATIDILVNRMNIGDLVLIPDGDDIYFAKITGDYYMSPANSDDLDYPHQRKIEWLARTSRKNLSKQLRSSLKVQRATADLSKHFDEIDALSKGEKYEVNRDSLTIPVSYPLRPDYVVSFNIPADITKEEAHRLSAYLETLYFS